MTLSDHTLIRRRICIGLATILTCFALTAGGEETWRFAVIGDTRGGGTQAPDHPWVNSPILQAEAAEVVNDGVSLVIVTGDLIIGNYSGFDVTNMSAQYAIWTNDMARVYQAQIPVYPVRGNHEIHDWHNDVDSVSAWRTAFGNTLPQNGPSNELGMTYSFAFSNAFFIGMDDYITNQTYRVNQTWLDAQLASNALTHIFVYDHEPAFTMTSTSLADYMTERNRFWDSIGTAGCRIYFCSHEHLYARAIASISNGPPVRHIVTGTGGAGLTVNWDGTYAESWIQNEHYTPSSLYGYTLVEISNRTVTVSWKALVDPTNIVWQVMDSFSYEPLTPVYRLYCGGDSATYEHLFTTSATEKDVLSGGPSWTYEGIAWYARGESDTGLVPLYRLYCPSIRQHHYTIDVNEYTVLEDNGLWNGEGIQYYVYAAASAGITPVYRFYHAGCMMHHFTAVEEERNAILAHAEWGYTDEGIAFYAHLNQ